MRRFSVILAAGLLAAAPAFASQPDPQRLADQSFEEAESAFARRDFAAAAASFEQAARFVPHPSPLLNAAEAWERAGELVHAAEDCDQVLSMRNAAAAHKIEAKKRLARMEPKIALVEVRGARTMTVQVDGGPQQVLPLRRRLAPGRHVVTLIDLVSAKSEKRVIDLAAGETLAIEAPAAADPAAAEGAEEGEAAEEQRREIAKDEGSGAGAATPPIEETGSEAADGPRVVEPRDTATDPDPGVDLTPPVELSSDTTPGDRRSGPPLLSWVAFGAGAAAAILGGTFGALTLSAQRSYDEAPTYVKADEFFARRLTTNVAFGVAIVAIGAGAVYWLFDEPGDEDREVEDRGDDRWPEPADRDSAGFAR